MSLVERDDELTLLRAVFTDCLRASGQVVIINGPVASGKTTLLHAFTDHASAQNARTLNATCSRSERSLPLGVITQLMSHPDIPAGSVPHVPRLLEDTATASFETEPQPDSINETTAQIMHDIYTTLLELAEQAPVIITVDDIEYADIPSLHCILYLARRLYASRIVIVLTDCDRMPSTHPVFHTELLRQPHCHSVRLNLLSQHGSAQILAQLLGDPTADQLSAEAHQASGGNPLLLHALAEDQHVWISSASAEQRTDGPRSLAIGNAFDRAVLSCLHRGGPDILSLARGIAVLGDTTGIVAPHHLLDIEPVSAARTLYKLTAAGLVENGGFRHPAVCAAVLRTLNTRDSAVLHGKAAKLLHSNGALPETVAGHLLNSTLDSPWSVDVLEEAAAEALTKDDPDLAATFLEKAYDACADDRHRAGIKADLVAIRWRVDPSDAARHYPALADAIRDGYLSGLRAVEMVKYMLWDGRRSDVAETLRILCDTIDEHDLDALAELRILRLWSASSHPTLLRRGQQEPRGPIGSCSDPTGTAEHTGATTPITITMDPRLQGAVILAEVLTNGADTTTLVWAEQVLQRSRLSKKTLDAVESAILALLIMLYADQSDVAATWCDRLLDESAALHAPTWQAMLSNARAGIAVRQGDLPLAYDHAQAAIRHISPQSWGVTVGFPLATLLLCTTGMGQYDAASRYLDQAVPKSMFQTRYALHYLHARGHYNLATKRHHAALADFLSCGDLMQDWEMDLPTLVPWRSSAAEAWLHLGNHDQARRLVNEQMARPGGDQPRTRGISLRTLAATSDVTQRIPLLQEAVKLLENCGARLELARTLGDLSQARYAMGEHSQARMEVHHAILVAEECGALPLREELLPKENTPGATPVHDILATLTDAERRVAALASHGYTNREIGDRLFVTVSTVEQHLTKVYRKLNVRHRKDLPHDLNLDIADTA